MGQNRIKIICFRFILVILVYFCLNFYNWRLMQTLKLKTMRRKIIAVTLKELNQIMKNDNSYQLMYKSMGF